MKGHRADRKLHLELLRARAAAERVELARAMHDISERLHPLQRAADAIESVAGAFSGRSRVLSWLAGGAAVLARAPWVRRAAVAARLYASTRPRVRTVLLGALAAGAVALLLRRRSRSRPQEPASQSGPGEQTG
jgi:hypothetical protein